MNGQRLPYRQHRVLPPSIRRQHFSGRNGTPRSEDVDQTCPSECLPDTDPRRAYLRFEGPVAPERRLFASPKEAAETSQAKGTRIWSRHRWHLRDRALRRLSGADDHREIRDRGGPAHALACFSGRAIRRVGHRMLCVYHSSEGRSSHWPITFARWVTVAKWNTQSATATCCTFLVA